MPSSVSADSTAGKVRAFLVTQPHWTHDQIARKCNTTKGYVDQVAAKMRRHEKSALPNRRAARAAILEADADGQRATTGEAPSVASPGLRLVTIQRLTPPAVSKDPEWACDQCGHKGTGKPPAACPKCGGA